MPRRCGARWYFKNRRIYYYRIRQVDNSGAAKYSLVVTVNLTGGNEGFDVQIVPDPGHETDIKIRLLNTTNTLSAIIHISDVSSKTIAVKPIMFSPSLQSFMPSVRAGVYFLIIKTETSTSVVRVVVQ